MVGALGFSNPCYRKEYLNPDQRVSSRPGSDPGPRVDVSSLQLVITKRSAYPFHIIHVRPSEDVGVSGNWSPPVYLVSLYPHLTTKGQLDQDLRIFWAFFRLRIRFLRHFQRIFPRFFHALEPRFIISPLGEKGENATPYKTFLWGRRHGHHTGRC